MIISLAGISLKSVGSGAAIIVEFTQSTSSNPSAKKPFLHRISARDMITFVPAVGNGVVVVVNDELLWEAFTIVTCP